MQKRLRVIVVILVVVSLIGAIQAKQFIGSLRTSDGEWCLVEREGKVALARIGRDVKSPTDGARPTWHVGAPYLQTAQGEYLVIDQHESDVTVHLAKEKSDAARWVIEVLSTTKAEHPKRGSKDELRMLVGTSASWFRLSVFEGRFKGLYLTADEFKHEGPRSVSEAKVARRLTVTKDPRRAIVFHYVDSRYDIIHK